MSARCVLVAVSFLSSPAVVFSQDTLTVADTLPGWAINLGVSRFGLRLGNSSRWNGVRINFSDRAVREVNGLNLTLWRPREESLCGVSGRRGWCGALRRTIHRHHHRAGRCGGGAVHARPERRGTGGRLAGRHRGRQPPRPRDRVAGLDVRPEPGGPGDRGLNLSGLAVVGQGEVRGLTVAGLAVVGMDGVAGVTATWRSPSSGYEPGNWRVPRSACTTAWWARSTVSRSVSSTTRGNCTVSSSA